MEKELKNCELSLEDIPEPDANWYEIGEFSLSFNGYDHWGTFEKCAAVSNRASQAYQKDGTPPDSLTELRTCLFFEQRRFRHFGTEPDE